MHDAVGNERVTPEGHLYGGEDLVVSVPLNDGWVALTSHRVLVFDPDADGKPFAAVERPNVSDVSFESSGDSRYLRWALRAAIYGVVSLAGGLALDAVGIASMLSLDAAPTPLSGVVSFVQTIAMVVQLVITVATVAGVALLVAAVGLVGLFAVSRHPTFVIERIGDTPLRYETTRAEGRRAATELKSALERVGE